MDKNLLWNIISDYVYFPVDRIKLMNKWKWMWNNSAVP